MKIGVVGLWHLGCVISASWMKQGHQVIGIDFNEDLIDQLSSGKAPIFEPGLDEVIAKGKFSTDPSLLEDCEVVFLAYDTPVDENDQCDLKILEKALDLVAPHLDSCSAFIVSSQVPVGTCTQFQKKIKAGIVYSPENLRLGEAIGNYLNPGHIVIGGDCEESLKSAKALFSTIPADYYVMDLCSAEMTKHAINSYLATSITFANQLSDICTLKGADYSLVAQAIKQDPRIGKKAYLKAGVGFSGGTLGRDLQILNGVGGNLFGDIWRFNRNRPQCIVDKMVGIIGDLDGKIVSLLGITYKPGTSTLRRSIPLEMARSLKNQGASVRVYDPKANWAEADMSGIEIYDDPYSMASGSDFIFLLTEWPEFKKLDFKRIGSSMATQRLFDPHRFLPVSEIEKLGFETYV